MHMVVTIALEYLALALDTETACLGLGDSALQSKASVLTRPGHQSLMDDDLQDVGPGICLTLSGLRGKWMIVGSCAKHSCRRRQTKLTHSCCRHRRALTIAVLRTGNGTGY